MATRKKCRPGFKTFGHVCVKKFKKVVAFILDPKFNTALSKISKYIRQVKP